MSNLHIIMVCFLGSSCIPQTSPNSGDFPPLFCHRLSSFPSIRFSEVPHWLTQPLPWFENGDWRQDEEDKADILGSEAGDDSEVCVAVSEFASEGKQSLQRKQWKEWLKSQRGPDIIQKGGLSHGPNSGASRHDEEWREWRKGRRRSDGGKTDESEQCSH